MNIAIIVCIVIAALAHIPPVAGVLGQHSIVYRTCPTACRL